MDPAAEIPLLEDHGVHRVSAARGEERAAAALRRVHALILGDGGGAGCCQPSVLIAVGTESAVKLEAVRAVFGGGGGGGGGATIVGTPNVESGVPPQPRGIAETARGALNRATAALGARGGSGGGTPASAPHLSVGIESGVWYAAAPERSDVTIGDAGVVDAAVVVVLVANGEGGGGAEAVGLYAVTATLDVPLQSSYDSGAAPVQRGCDGEWSALKDPHAVITNGARPRGAFLAEALRSFLP